jgi:hypothetical protein
MVKVTAPPAAFLAPFSWYPLYIQYTASSMYTQFTGSCRRGKKYTAVCTQFTGSCRRGKKYTHCNRSKWRSALKCMKHYFFFLNEIEFYTVVHVAMHIFLHSRICKDFLEPLSDCNTTKAPARTITAPTIMWILIKKSGLFRPCHNSHVQKF